jgi:hypothetical protein
LLDQDIKSKALNLSRSSNEGSRINFPRAFILVSAVLLLWVMFFTPIGRYLTYDEATFYGQSGGLDGIDVTPPWMAASREHGTSLIIEWIRTFAQSLASTQLVWTLLSFALTVGAFWEIGRWTGRRGALVGLAVYMTGWVATALTGSFYGSFIGAAAVLLTAGLYLRLRHQEGYELRNGLLLGLAASLLMAMRNLESALALSVIVGHALIWHPLQTLKKWRGILVAVVTFTAVYVIPWTLETNSRFGSVMERYRAARNQGHPFALHNGLEEWSRVLLGIDPHFARIDPLPQVLLWLYGALYIVIALGGVAFVLSRAFGFLRHKAVEGESRHSGLIFALGSVSLGLFFLFSQDIKERYLAFGLVAGSLLFGHAIVEAYRRWGRRPRLRASLAVAAAAAAAGWLLLNGMILGRVQHERVVENAQLERLGGMMYTIAGGRSCRVLGYASTPPIQIASGCKTAGGRGALQRGGFDSLADALRSPRVRDSQVIFVVWKDEIDAATAAALDWWEQREGRQWIRIQPADGRTFLRRRGDVLYYMVRE